MKNFPSKTYTLESPLPPEEVLKRLDAQLAEGKEFHGAVTGNSFSMHNHSKLPSVASGTVAPAGSGSAISVKVEQEAKMTIGEGVLLVVLCIAGALFFPDLMSDPPHIAMMIVVILVLYGICFFSEVEQSRSFLAEAAEVPDAV